MACGTKKEKSLNISELAKLAGLGIQTIRFYERKELVPAPKRTESGYRQYDTSYLEHIRFVKNLQELGFSLEEIYELAQLKFNKRALGKRVKKLIQKKLEQIDDEINKLQKSQKELLSLDLSCSGDMPTSCCPIIKSLGHSS